VLILCQKCVWLQFGQSFSQTRLVTLSVAKLPFNFDEKTPKQFFVAFSSESVNLSNVHYRAMPQISGAIVAQQSRLTCPIKNPQIVSPFKTLLRTGDLCKRVKLFYLNVSNFARLRSQRPLHVQGDAGLPG
jgi:hypothetical protein